MVSIMNGSHIAALDPSHYAQQCHVIHHSNLAMYAVLQFYRQKLWNWQNLMQGKNKGYVIATGRLQLAFS